MGTPHIGMGRDMSIFQIGESPYQYGVHSNLGTYIDISDMIKLFFLNSSLMSIHITHHTYNIALTKKNI